MVNLSETPIIHYGLNIARKERGRKGKQGSNNKIGKVLISKKVQILGCAHELKWNIANIVIHRNYLKIYLRRFPPKIRVMLTVPVQQLPTRPCARRGLLLSWSQRLMANYFPMLVLLQTTIWKLSLGLLNRSRLIKENYRKRTQWSSCFKW